MEKITRPQETELLSITLEDYPTEQNLTPQWIETSHFLLIWEKEKLSKDGMKESQSSVSDKKQQSHAQQPMHMADKESEASSLQMQP